MNSSEIKYIIDNKQIIFEKLDNILTNLPQETVNRIQNLFETLKLEEAFNIINGLNPNSGITLLSLKVFIFLENPEFKDLIFSNEEYISFLKEFVDIYGERIVDYINISTFRLDVSIFDTLLTLGDPKYLNAYNSIVRKTLSYVSTVNNLIQVLNSINKNYVTEEFIVNYLDEYQYPLTGSDCRELLQVLPKSILEDGLIAKMLVGKIDYFFSEDDKILDYIPSNLYTPEFINQLLNKNKYNFENVFNHIPAELRTREVWEKACRYSSTYINEIPDNNIDPNITQEEYNLWIEDLIIKMIVERPEDILSNFSRLSDSKKSVSVCQKVVEAISFEDNFKYNDLLKSIPDSSKTRILYEAIVDKTPYVLREIPFESFLSNITQDEYDRWFEDLISQSIKKYNDIELLRMCIPISKINERIWNEFLDKCIELGVSRDNASLSIVNIENITPQMVERAMSEIDVTQLYYVPCIDQNLDNLYGDKKEKYAKWKASLTEEQKQLYRDWYEKTWISFVNKTQGYGSIYRNVPKEGITTNMNKACIDINFTSIDLMPKPETQEEIYEYQQLLIYALSKIPTIDYLNERDTLIFGDRDIFENIPKEFISEEVIRHAIEKNSIYLNYLDPTSPNFKELVDRAFKYKLARMGRTNLSSKELELIHRFAINNADLFKTLQLDILDPKIIDAIGESSLERITRFKDVQYSVLSISSSESALKTFGFALENLKRDSIFIEPLIEKLSKAIYAQQFGKYNAEIKSYVYESTFLDLVSQRIDSKDIPFTDYEKTIISYLALNPKEGRKITTYEDILTFVERKNNELENIIKDSNSTLVDVKNAYLERIVGLDYNTVVDLVTMFGNDPEELLKNYENIGSDLFKELSEREALEIIIKLKSLIETQDINSIRSEFNNIISNENEENSFLRYQKSTVLETTLRRAYGRDLVDSLSNDVGSLEMEERDFNGDKYFVRKVDGNFNRMVSLLGAYRKSSTTDGDMYDRWNTRQMASNHALCYSLINQSNPGTAMINGKTGVIISIDGFSPESITAEAPYDLCSDNRQNIIFIMRQQRFFTTKNMPNKTRGMYSEYDIEIEDVLSHSEQYQKIQPATIICFEKIDEESINAAIELGKKLGHPVPIELIDRRELAKNEMIQIKDMFNKFISSESIDTTLVEEIITRFNNVRNAHRFSDLKDELLGEDKDNENKDALFNIEHLNQMLKVCLSSIEQRIRDGKVQEGLEGLEDIKRIIFEERQKSFLMPEMYHKQEWTGIDLEIDCIIDELKRTYGKQRIKSFEGIKSLEVISDIYEHDKASITFDAMYGQFISKPEQLTVEQVMQFIDASKVEKSVEEIHYQGYYQGNKSYDEEHIARVVLYSDVISKMEGFDDKTRELVTEVAKYYSCGRQLDVAEQHEQYSARIAGNELNEKYSQEYISIIQASIEFLSFSISTKVTAFDL